MSNALLEYLNKRLENKDVFSSKKKNPGPLITISREVGCSGVKLAEKIASRLNKRHLGPDWKVLSKEVFFQSAKELHMEPDRVKRIFKYSESYTLNEILNAFGNKKFKSERKVIKTVNEVIHSFAEEGFCIIVGRAAHIIAQDIQNALHVRLVAPCDYRIKVIMGKNHLNYEEAIDFINRVEKERKTFRKAIGKDATEDFLFDLFINRATFDDEKSIDLIEFAAQKKEIFKDYSPTIDYY
jgi:cytidylate kinase